MDDHPYEKLLAAYVESWIEDAVFILTSKKLTYVSHRYTTLSLILLGCKGKYNDYLMDIAATILGMNKPELWQLIYKQAIKRAWEYKYGKAI